jgi:hypothetical protein
MLMLIVEKFKLEHDVEISINYNLTDEHYHETDVKKLVDLAHNDGCDWIIPSDADEILYIKYHKNIQEILQEFGSFDHIALRFRWRDFRSDKDVHFNAFKVMKYGCTKYMDVDNVDLVKSCGKLNDSMSFVPGAHLIQGATNVINIPESIAEYRHYPERNLEQYEKKMMLQYKNWKSRYGFFYAEEYIEKDPDHFKKIWPDRKITQDGSRRICNSSKTDPKIQHEYVVEG